MEHQRRAVVEEILIRQIFFRRLQVMRQDIGQRLEFFGKEGNFGEALIGQRRHRAVDHAVEFFRAVERQTNIAAVDIRAQGAHAVLKGQRRLRPVVDAECNVHMLILEQKTRVSADFA